MTSLKTVLSRATVITIMLTGATVTPSTRGNDEIAQTARISVTGTGTVSVKPDIAELHVGVVSQAKSAQAALAQNKELMVRLVKALKERGVAEKDIQPAQIQISPQYSQPPPSPLVSGDTGTAPGPQQAAPEFIPRVVGYHAENSVRIVSRRIDQLGPLLDALVQGGANQIYGIAFRMDHPDPHLDEARIRAMADAKHKALLLAHEAGMDLGAPLEIEEQDASVAPRARMLGDMDPQGGAAAPMPVAAGEQEVSVSVSVAYELRKPK